ncbi:hypothetical protein [Streptomyces griseiscabiei]|uniref:Secreted protein n=1 Tax=Streptomyces griseiscabiei TaxID=2993540 RepID=A0ABU4L978_9ACTN|nr:hypothetical protein [Streptomyces griseiscabiei]MBZ3907014.1 hypothetical protein [Streptomyces griseiscabiei]MDX2911603.1 hypothetical protein [Streptomyces griseiscabiei]
MELPADDKRTGLLALGVLGILFVLVLVMFTVFDGDEEGGEEDGPAAAATGQADSATQGQSSSDTDEPSGGGPSPIVTSAELSRAHAVMARYMAGITTYDHRSDSGAWRGPLLELTTGETRMKQVTTLPTGKAWDTCVAEKCSSKGEADVVRDAVISADVTRNSGRSISSLVKVTATVTASGDTTTETNRWLVSVEEKSGQWVVSGFDVFGLGDVGASDQAGE